MSRIYWWLILHYIHLSNQILCGVSESRPHISPATDEQETNLSLAVTYPSVFVSFICIRSASSLVFQVVTEYYAKAKERNTDCKNFELEVMFKKENRGQDFIQ